MTQEEIDKKKEQEKKEKARKRRLFWAQQLMMTDWMTDIPEDFATNVYKYIYIYSKKEICL